MGKVDSESFVALRYLSIGPDIDENRVFGEFIDTNDPGLVWSLNSNGIVDNFPCIVGELDLLGKVNKGCSSIPVPNTQILGASVIFKI